ncbi:asparagine synthetase B, partial [Vibrio parahaemolyticus]|nr:asparagine synthetase B [Vibrio parahaemolyticus]
AVIVFNGEIYNHPELRKELSARGYHFNTNSDTETLLNAYLAYGTDCLSKLRGMFAFAIWDLRTETLFIARDRIGKKPLFYARGNDGTLVFAS